MEIERDSLQTKTEKYFSLPDHQFAEDLISVLICKKGKKEDKNKFGTKSLGIIATIVFM